MLKNNKGFTMVELLATVTILGILATIVTVSVTKTMQKAHKEYDQKQNRLFTTAAQTYFTDNRSELPKKLLTTSEVTLQELIDKNYIEEIVDYKKKAYDKYKSKAYVKKTGAGKYIYYSVLVGSDDRKIEDIPTDKKSNTISVQILSYDANGSKRTIPISDVYYINNTLKINFKLDGGISSYQYKINKLSNITSAGKKYKTSGEIAVDKESFNDTLTVDAKDFANGIYQIEIDAYNYEGNLSKTVKSKKFVIDKTKPKCEISSISGTKGNKVENLGDVYWYTSDAMLSISVEDDNKYEYAYKYMNNSTSYEIKTTYPIKEKIENGKGVFTAYVIDKAGNFNECSKEVYVDKVAPRVNEKVSYVRSSVSSYNALTVDIDSHIIDENKTKYEVYNSSDGKCESNKKYSELESIGPQIYKRAFNVGGTLDGGSRTICIQMTDEAGNTWNKKFSYTIYKECSDSTGATASCGTYGACSDACGGTQYADKTYSWIDSKTSKACSSVETNGCSQSCGGHIPSCSETTGRTACTNECGGGTWNVLNSCIEVATDNSKTCSGYYSTIGRLEACGSETRIEYAWAEDECSNTCGNGTTTKEIYYDTFGIYGNVCRTEQTETQTIACTDNSNCTTKKCNSWGDCICDLETGKCTKTRKCWKVDSEGNKSNYTTNSKTCSYPSHTHIWKARGNTIRTDNLHWTCTHGHSGLIQHYNIYCTKCAKLKTSSPKFVCPTAPYGKNDGWEVVDDSGR